jgi:hypothetical protein
MQNLFALHVEDAERSVADNARQAYRFLKSIREWSNRTRYAARYPGSSRGYDDPSVDFIIALERIEAEDAISMMKLQKGLADGYRADGALAAKRATYFSELKQKYERGASRPRASIEPDAPPPK